MAENQVALRHQIEGIIREHVYANVQYGADGILSGVPQAAGLILAAVESAALRDTGTDRGGAVEAPEIVLRDLSPEEAQARYQALIDARWRQRVAEAYALADPAAVGGET